MAGLDPQLEFTRVAALDIAELGQARVPMPSIFFQQTFYENERWTRGSSPRVTHLGCCKRTRLLHFHLDAIARRCSGRKGALRHEAPDECGAGIAIDPWLRRFSPAGGLDANDFLERHVGDDRVDLAVAHIGREREADRGDADMFVER